MINPFIQTAGICTLLFVLPAAHMCGFQSEAACAVYGAYYNYAVAEGTVTHVVYAGQETPGVVQIRVSSQAGRGPLPGFLYIFFKPKFLSPYTRDRIRNTGTAAALKQGQRTYVRVKKDRTGLIIPIACSQRSTQPVPWDTIQKAFSFRKELNKLDKSARNKKLAEFFTSGDPVRTKIAMAAHGKLSNMDEMLKHAYVEDPDSVGRAAYSGYVRFYLGQDRYIKPLGRLWSGKPVKKLIRFAVETDTSHAYRKLTAQEALIVRARQGDERAVRFWLGLLNGSHQLQPHELISAFEALKTSTGRKEILDIFITYIESLPLSQKAPGPLLQGIANGGTPALQYIKACVTGKRKMPVSKWGPRIGESMAKKITDPSLGSGIMEFLSFRNTQTRIFACTALASIKHETAADSIRQIYSSTTEQPRVAAAAGKALLCMPRKTAVPFAAQILAKNNPIVFAWKAGPHSLMRFNLKSTAIHSVSRFSTARAAETLIRFIRAKPRNPRDAYLEPKALKALAHMKTAKAMQFIHGYLLKEAKPSLGILIINTLSDNGTHESYAILADISGRPKHPLFPYAAAVLSESEKQAEQLCARIFASEQPASASLDFILAKGLILCRKPEYARYQATYLTHSDPAVRAMAISGLYKRFGTTLGYDPFAEAARQRKYAEMWEKKIQKLKQ